jgi:hypothetical protein
MKRLWPCLLFLFGNEILSYIVLIVYATMLLLAIIKEAERSKNGD